MFKKYKRLSLFFWLIIFTSIFAVGINTAGGDQQIYLETSVLYSKERLIVGSNILFHTDIIIFGDKNSEIVDVIFEYSIMDSKGNIVYKIVETKDILLRADIFKEIRLHSDIESGFYTLNVKAGYDGIIRSTSNAFEVVKIETLLISGKRK